MIGIPDLQPPSFKHRIRVDLIEEAGEGREPSYIQLASAMSILLTPQILVSC